MKTMYRIEDVKELINEINSKTAGRMVTAEKDEGAHVWHVVTTYDNGRESYSYKIENLAQLCQYLAGYADALN